MKQLAVVVVILIVMAAGIPPVVGTLAQNHLTQQANIISENELLAVNVRAYERGWLTSSLLVDVELSGAYQERLAEILTRGEDQPASVANLEERLGRTISLAVDLSHGPIIAEGSLRAGFASSVIRLDSETEGLDKLLTKLGIPYLLEIRTHSSFTGSSVFEVEVPPIILEDPNGTFNLSGFTAEGSYDLAARHLITDGHIESIEIGSEFATVKAENLTLNGDFRMLSSYIGEGSTKLVLERMTVLNATPTGPPFIEASNVGFAARTSLNDAGDRLDIDTSYHVDSVTGDDLSFTDGRFDLAIRNLDMTAVEAYNRITQGSVFQSGEMAILHPEFQETLYQLLAAEPALELGPLNFTWNGNAFEAALRIRTDAEMLPPQAAFSLLTPSLWTRLFAVEMNVDIAQDLAERVATEAAKYQLRRGGGQELTSEELDAMAEAQGPGMLLLLVAQSMVDVSQIGYRSELSLEQGILEVNGREIPLGPQF